MSGLVLDGAASGGLAAVVVLFVLVTRGEAATALGPLLFVGLACAGVVLASAADNDDVAATALSAASLLVATVGLALFAYAPDDSEPPPRRRPPHDRPRVPPGGRRPGGEHVRLGSQPGGRTRHEPHPRVSRARPGRIAR